MHKFEGRKEQEGGLGFETSPCRRPALRCGCEMVSGTNAVPDAGVDGGLAAGWNLGECGRRSVVVWGARNGRALLRLVGDTAAVRGTVLMGFRNVSGVGGSRKRVGADAIEAIAGHCSRKARGARKVPTCLSLGELGGLCVSTESHNENRYTRSAGKNQWLRTTSASWLASAKHGAMVGNSARQRSAAFGNLEGGARARPNCSN
jgi:hypothetical protein